MHAWFFALAFVVSCFSKEQFFIHAHLRVEHTHTHQLNWSFNHKKHVLFCLISVLGNGHRELFVCVCTCQMFASRFKPLCDEKAVDSNGAKPASKLHELDVSELKMDVASVIEQTRNKVCGNFRTCEPQQSEQWTWLDKSTPMPKHNKKVCYSLNQTIDGWPWVCLAEHKDAYENSQSSDSKFSSACPNCNKLREFAFDQEMDHFSEDRRNYYQSQTQASLIDSHHHKQHKKQEIKFVDSVVCTLKFIAHKSHAYRHKVRVLETRIAETRASLNQKELEGRSETSRMVLVLRLKDLRAEWEAIDHSSLLRWFDVDTVCFNSAITFAKAYQMTKTKCGQALTMLTIVWFVLHRMCWRVGVTEFLDVIGEAYIASLGVFAALSRWDKNLKESDWEYKKAVLTAKIRAQRKPLTSILKKRGCYSAIQNPSADMIARFTRIRLEQFMSTELTRAKIDAVLGPEKSTVAKKLATSECFETSHAWVKCWLNKLLCWMELDDPNCFHHGSFHNFNRVLHKLRAFRTRGNVCIRRMVDLYTKQHSAKDATDEVCKKRKQPDSLGTRGAPFAMQAQAKFDIHSAIKLVKSKRARLNNNNNNNNTPLLTPDPASRSDEEILEKPCLGPEPSQPETCPCENSVYSLMLRFCSVSGARARILCCASPQCVLRQNGGKQHATRAQCGATPFAKNKVPPSSTLSKQPSPSCDGSIFWAGDEDGSGMRSRAKLAMRRMFDENRLTKVSVMPTNSQMVREEMNAIWLALRWLVCIFPDLWSLQFVIFAIDPKWPEECERTFRFSRYPKLGEEVMRAALAQGLSKQELKERFEPELKRDPDWNTGVLSPVCQSMITGAQGPMRPTPFSHNRSLEPSNVQDDKRYNSLVITPEHAQ